MKQKLIITIALLHIVLFTIGQKTPPSPLTDTAKIAELEEKASKAKSKFAGMNFTPFGATALSNLLSNVSVSSFLEKGVNGKIELKQYASLSPQKNENNNLFELNGMHGTGFDFKSKIKIMKNN